MKGCGGQARLCGTLYVLERKPSRCHCVVESGFDMVLILRRLFDLSLPNDRQPTVVYYLRGESKRADNFGKGLCSYEAGLRTPVGREYYPPTVSGRDGQESSNGTCLGDR